MYIEYKYIGYFLIDFSTCYQLLKMLRVWTRTRPTSAHLQCQPQPTATRCDLHPSPSTFATKLMRIIEHDEQRLHFPNMLFQQFSRQIVRQIKGQINRQTNFIVPPPSHIPPPPQPFLGIKGSGVDGLNLHMLQGLHDELRVLGINLSGDFQVPPHFSHL